MTLLKHLPSYSPSSFLTMDTFSRVTTFSVSFSLPKEFCRLSSLDDKVMTCVVNESLTVMMGVNIIAFDTTGIYSDDFLGSVPVEVGRIDLTQQVELLRPIIQIRKVDTLEARPWSGREEMNTVGYELLIQDRIDVAHNLFSILSQKYFYGTGNQTDKCRF